MRNQEWDRRGSEWSRQDQGWTGEQSGSQQQSWGGGQQQSWGGGGEQWGGREQNWSRRDQDLSNEDLKLVRYKILFVKRDLEVAFPDQEDLITDSLSSVQFAGIKIAKFIRGLSTTRRPDRWKERNYPPTAAGDMINEIPQGDEKYLRIYYEVLERFPREEANYEREQVEVLREIRDRLGSSAADPPTPPKR